MPIKMFMNIIVQFLLFIKKSYLYIIDTDPIEVILIIEVIDPIPEFLVILVETVHLLLLQVLFVLRWFGEVKFFMGVWDCDGIGV